MKIVHECLIQRNTSIVITHSSIFAICSPLLLSRHGPVDKRQDQAQDRHSEGDNESEAVVQKSLEKLSENRTTFTIAHRLTTIKNASRILYLTPDGITEEGTHTELLKKGGDYAKLYSLYSQS
jgi:hypothetical protein